MKEWESLDKFITHVMNVENYLRQYGEDLFLSKRDWEISQKFAKKIWGGDIVSIEKSKYFV